MTQRIAVAEKTRGRLRALIDGRLGTGADRSDLVRMAVQLIVEEVLEGEARDKLGRERYERAEGEASKPASRPATKRRRARIARDLRAGIMADYADSLPTAARCFEDDFEACIAHLRLPVTHRRSTRTTNLIERLFGEERRRLKIVPNAFRREARPEADVRRADPRCRKLARLALHRIRIASARRRAKGSERRVRHLYHPIRQAISDALFQQIRALTDDLREMRDGVTKRYAEDRTHNKLGLPSTFTLDAYRDVLAKLDASHPEVIKPHEII
jgi:transposase-like protein